MLGRRAYVSAECRVQTPNFGAPNLKLQTPNSKHQRAKDEGRLEKRSLSMPVKGCKSPSIVVKGVKVSSWVDGSSKFEVQGSRLCPQPPEGVGGWGGRIVEWWSGGRRMGRMGASFAEASTAAQSAMDGLEALVRQGFHRRAKRFLRRAKRYGGQVGGRVGGTPSPRLGRAGRLEAAMAWLAVAAPGGGRRDQHGAG